MKPTTSQVLAALFVLASLVTIQARAFDLFGINRVWTEARPISSDEFNRRIVGNTLVGGYRARHYRFYVGEAGLIRGQLGLTGSDDGRWWLEDDLFCYEWADYFIGEARCYRWFMNGDRVVLRNADAFRIQDVYGRMMPGKPEGY